MGEGLGGHHKDSRAEEEKKETQIRAAAQDPSPVHIASSEYALNSHPSDPKANAHLYFSTGPRYSL